MSPGCKPPLKEKLCSKTHFSLNRTHLNAGDPMITFHTKTPFRTVGGTGSFLCCISSIICGVSVNMVIPMNFRLGPSVTAFEELRACARNSFT